MSEDKNKREELRKAKEIIAEFVNAEFEIITDINETQLREVEPLIEQNNHLRAGTQILNHANQLRQIGRENIIDQILAKALDIFLEGELFEEFFVAFNSLSIEMQKKYLIRIFPIFLDKLRGIEELDDYERKEKR
jgi:hypothetical protein